MRRVGFLLEQIRLNGESKEVKDEIIDLGTRYGIVTPYTSYLVLEPGMRPQIAGIPSPAGRPSADLAPSGTSQAVIVTGESAVRMSKRKSALKDAASGSTANSRPMTSCPRPPSGSEAINISI
jgi:Ca-activated chloride channel family protein